MSHWVEGGCCGVVVVELGWQRFDVVGGFVNFNEFGEWYREVVDDV